MRIRGTHRSPRRQQRRRECGSQDQATGVLLQEASERTGRSKAAIGAYGHIPSPKLWDCAVNHLR